jgi:DNA-binding transcriptional ArsR family regulator
MASKIKHHVKFFKALGHETRLKALRYLWTTPCMGAPMAKLREHLGVSKANLSQHMSILRDSGLIYIKPIGRPSLVYVVTDNELLLQVLDALEAE